MDLDTWHSGGLVKQDWWLSTVDKYSVEIMVKLTLQAVGVAPQRLSPPKQFVLLAATSASFVAATLLAAACTHRFSAQLLKILRLPTHPAPLPDDDASLVGFLLVDVRPLVSSLLLYILYKYFIRYLLIGIIRVSKVAVHVDRRFSVRARVQAVVKLLRSGVWQTIEVLNDSIISTSSTKLGLQPS